MKVRDLIKLLESKPQDLEVYLQELVGNPLERKLSMSSLYECEVAVMKNVDTPYLAIGCTCDGVADADGSVVKRID